MRQPAGVSVRAEGIAERKRKNSSLVRTLMVRTLEEGEWRARASTKSTSITDDLDKLERSEQPPRRSI